MFWDRVAGVYDLFVNGINRNPCAVAVMTKKT